MKKRILIICLVSLLLVASYVNVIGKSLNEEDEIHTKGELKYPSKVGAIGGGIISNNKENIEITSTPIWPCPVYALIIKLLGSDAKPAIVSPLKVEILQGEVEIFTFMAGVGVWVADFTKFWYSEDHWLQELPGGTKGEYFTLGAGDSISALFAIIIEVDNSIGILFLSGIMTDNQPYNNEDHPGWYLLRFWTGG
ncbi:MAG: hypothetical protein JSW62_02980 [Thermoplasmatales archaeon]|nr:MAG: hypothetical protein JSW62_02980 [Thermoplasmatales archaeon]